jgi:hypothetical protein
MVMSLTKLEDLLASKGFVAKSYYTLDDYCIYIEVLNVTNASIFMLYITARYGLKVTNRPNIFDLRYMEITNEDNIASNYGDEPDNVDMEKFYNNFDIELNTNSSHDEDLEKRLKENYEIQLYLKDLNKDDVKNLKDIFRQLNRFMFCVKNIKYKFSIMYKNYLCSITKDDELDAFLILNFPKKDERRIYIYLDLKSLYEKNLTFTEDIVIVRQGLQRLLDQNQVKHTKILNEMIEQKVELQGISDSVIEKKIQLDNGCKEYEILLADIIKSEQVILDKMEMVRSKYSDYSLKGLHNDIEKAHQIAQLQNELAKITSVKNEIINNIIIIKAKHENMTLKMDKILFDNSIMINEINNNFKKLKELT